MAVRRPLIIDGGSIKELPSGDSLPAVAKTAATLTHSAGTITLDVQAADVFRFEADEYSAGGPIAQVGATTYAARQATSITLPSGLAEGDVVLMIGHAYGAETVSLPSGYTEILDYDPGNSRLHLSYKVMGSTPDTSQAVSSATGWAAIGLRGVDTGSVVNTPPTSSYSNLNADPDAGARTSTVDGCWHVVAASIKERVGISDNPEGQSLSGFSMIAEAVYVAGTYDYWLQVYSQEKDPAGTVDPAALVEADDHAITHFAVQPAQSSGEKDYTFTFSNIPASGIAAGHIDLELKTGTGSIAFTGGTVTWRGTEPDFDEAGHYLIRFIADSSGITLWREA